MAQPTRSENDFSLKIDYEKSSGEPSRVFQAMSDLIDAMQETDKELVKSVGTQIKPAILLEEIEANSVRAWLRQTIESIDDEGLRKGDYKLIIGKYLIKAKYIIVDFLRGKNEITDAKEIELLEKDLFQLAKNTKVLRMPFYEPISRIKLLKSIEQINLALSPLNNTDAATFESQGAAVPFNLSLNITPEKIEEIATVEKIETTAEMILMVKKPDFLGESQWEFRWGRTAMRAKILDNDWVEEFHEGRFVIKPGDSLRGLVQTEARYGVNSELVSRHFAIVDVIEIIPGDDQLQLDLFGDETD